MMLLLVLLLAAPALSETWVLHRNNASAARAELLADNNTSYKPVSGCLWLLVLISDRQFLGRALQDLVRCLLTRRDGLTSLVQRQLHCGACLVL